MKDLLTKAPKMDPALVDIDRLANRWSAGDRGTGSSLHPLEAIRLLHDGAVLGGGQIPTPEDVIVFDRCFNQAAPRDRAIITVWYTSGGSVDQKARRVGVSRSQLYIEWGRTLSYFRGWVRAQGIDC